MPSPPDQSAVFPSLSARRVGSMSGRGTSNQLSISGPVIGMGTLYVAMQHHSLPLRLYQLQDERQAARGGVFIRGRPPWVDGSPLQGRVRRTSQARPSARRAPSRSGWERPAAVSVIALGTPS